MRRNTMFKCLHCGFVPREAAAFCPACGASFNAPMAYQGPNRGQVYQPMPPVGHHMMAARGFGQIFGILPSVTFLTFVIDMMLFGGEAMSLGAILPLQSELDASSDSLPIKPRCAGMGMIVNPPSSRV